MVGAREAKATMVGDGIRQVMGARSCVALQGIEGPWFLFYVKWGVWSREVM